MTHCPSCDESLRVAAWRCPACALRIEGDFVPSPLARLSDEHQGFLVSFVRCRGVLRDLEQELGLSYPTVRARLDAAVSALEEVLRPPAPEALARREVLEAVAAGELDPESAARRLRGR
ncbi:MAG: DUF2089 domain-containing protein [Armatimonadota bacterium]